jgi:hypothetical protein
MRKVNLRKFSNNQFYLKEFYQAVKLEKIKKSLLNYNLNLLLHLAFFIKKKRIQNIKIY